MANKLPIITWSDVGITVALPILLLISWSQPPRVWQSVSMGISRGLSLILVGRAKQERTFLQNLFKDRGRSHRLDELQRRILGDKFLQLIEYLRELRPGGWRPNISLSGVEHIDYALRQGNGIILWVVPARSAELIVKRSLKEAGYSVAHLMLSSHGMSQSRYGRMILNKIMVNSEKRYLYRRLLTDKSEVMCSMRWAREFLTNRGIVSLTMSGHGKQRAKVNVFGCKMGLATGAPNLALRTGAALLPVVTRPGKPGVFDIRIEPPIEPPSTSNRSEAIEHMAQRLGRILERELLEIDPASRICSYVQMLELGGPRPDSGNADIPEEH